MPPPAELFSPKSPVTISSEHTISPLSPLHEHSALPMPQIAAPECSWSGEREKLYAQLRILKSQSSPPLVTPSFRLPVCQWYATGYLFYFIYFISYLFINLFVSFFLCLSLCLDAYLHAYIFTLIRTRSPDALLTAPHISRHFLLSSHNVLMFLSTPLCSIALF